MLLITGELRRVLKKTGTMWWNHGDSYSSARPLGTNDNGSTGKLAGGKKIRFALSEQNKNRGNSLVNDIPEKSLLFQNYRLMIRMIDEQQWILRNTIIWHKPNCMPSSVKDRFTVDYEPVFFFTKNKKYWFEQQFENFESNDYDRARMANAREVHGGKLADNSGGAIKTQRAFVAGNKQGRTKRCVWKINTKPFPESHFAVFPEALIEIPIKAGCPEKGIVLDPFMGSGTTAVVAKQLNRQWIGIELNKNYVEMANQRIASIPNSLFV